MLEILNVKDEVEEMVEENENIYDIVGYVEEWVNNEIRNQKLEDQQMRVFLDFFITMEAYVKLILS